MDTTKIDGYAEMSLEDKVKALEDYELTPDYSGYVKKDVFDKTASDLAKIKKKLKDYQSEDESKKEEEAEKWKELQTKYNDLLKERDLSKAETKYVAMGYDTKLARKAATALIEGDTEKLFELQAQHIEQVKQDARKAAIKDTPAPTPGPGAHSLTKADLDKMTPIQRYRFKQDSPEVYKELYGD